MNTVQTSSSSITTHRIHSLVLSFGASPYACRVLIGLEEKGIKYEDVPQSFPFKSPLLLQMNPVNKKVPVLIHNAKPVAESLIALQYIDEVWTEGLKFLPSHPYDQAMARFWADFVNNIFDAGARILRGTGDEQKAGKREYIENLVILEGNLKGKEYFGGDEFGLVDIAFVPQISWFPIYEMIGEFKVPFEEKLPCISAWIKKCKERESVKKILPSHENVVQFSTQVRKFFLVQA